MTPPLSAEQAIGSLKLIKFHIEKGNIDEAMAALLAACEEAIKNERRLLLGLQTVLQRTTDLTNGYDDGYAQGFADARRKVKNLCEEKIEREIALSKGIGGQAVFQCQAAIDAISELEEAVDKLAPEGQEK